MSELFRQTIQHGNLDYRVEVHSRVRRSGFEHMVLATTIDLMEKGYITTINHEPDHCVVGLRDAGDRAIAYIVFEPRTSQNLVHVVLGGTDESHRQTGLYSRLFEELAKYLRRPHVQDNHHSDPRLAGITKITGCYHVDNESARIMNERLGRKPVRVTTEFVL